MARHLNFNPGRESVEYLEAITCGENRKYILDQLLISLRAEIGRPNHQHHLLIGPRGAGKTHLLRLLTAGRIPLEPLLANTYLPIVMPEETPLRSPGDLFLKFVEKLVELLRAPPEGISADAARGARAICLNALASAKGMKEPGDRLELMATALDSAAKTVGRIVLPIAENMDQTFYLGAQRGRKGPLDEQWALRRHLQETPHIFLIGAAPSMFGAVGDPGKPFYDFFRTHELQELSNDEVLEIIQQRLKQEAGNPKDDGMRHERVQCILDHFAEKSPQLRGLLAITGGLPRFTHLTYEVIVETDVDKILDTLNGFLDDLTPYFQHRLDPRIIPQPEIDLLHALALARGPQQPSELAAGLYGVQTNEVSELLGRLQERGLVKRAGRPGGQAVTWDLTEPLYRVWTQFRDNPDGQDIYRMLGKFVALLFTETELKKDRDQLAERLVSLPEADRERKMFGSRLLITERALEYHKSIDRVRSAVSKETAQTENPPLLKKLRALNTAHPDDAALREKLAKGLFNAFNDASDANAVEQARALLEELRQLSAAHADDAAVREKLAMVLVNASAAAGDVGDLAQSNALLEELRGLNANHPDDVAVREELAKGLFNAFNDACGADAVGQARALLEELRQLSAAHADDAAVRKELAMGLVNAIYYAGKTGDLAQSNALLEELRGLNGNHPDDAAVREELAKGLFNAFNSTGKAGDLVQSGALLEELRQLSAVHADDVAVREKLAKGLFNAFNDASDADAVEQARALLEELRQLSAAHTDDAAVREKLAMGLFNAFNDASDANAVEQARALLEELRQLSAAHADDAAVREKLAMGLVNASAAAGDVGDLAQSNALLEELRGLNGNHPDDVAVREELAKGLVNATYDAGKAGAAEQSRALLDELRQLSMAHSYDAAVREKLAMGLFNAFNDASDANAVEQARALLDELRQLSAAHADDAAVRENLADGLVNAIYDARNADDFEQSRMFLKELLGFMEGEPGEAVQEAVQRAVMLFCNTALNRAKSGDMSDAKGEMRWLESRLPSAMAELIRPMSLAMNVLDKGEEQALAREPEEVRRVVRMVLEKLDDKK
jgi:hypothetical protein